MGIWTDQAPTPTPMPVQLEDTAVLAPIKQYPMPKEAKLGIVPTSGA